MTEPALPDCPLCGEAMYPSLINTLSCGNNDCALCTSTVGHEAVCALNVQRAELGRLRASYNSAVHTRMDFRQALRDSREERKRAEAKLKRLRSRLLEEFAFMTEDCIDYETEADQAIAFWRTRLEVLLEDTQADVTETGGSDE